MKRSIFILLVLLLVSCEKEVKVSNNTKIIQVNSNGLICSAYKYNDDVLITAAHCVRDADVTQIKYNNRMKTVVKVVVHPDWDSELVRNDLAMIILNKGNLPANNTIGYLNFANGDKITSVTYTNGRKKAKEHTFKSFDEDRFRVLDNSKSDSICVGNSGGPAYIDNGQEVILVGIISAITNIRRNCNDGGDTLIVNIEKFQSWIDEVLQTHYTI